MLAKGRCTSTTESLSALMQDGDYKFHARVIGSTGTDTEAVSAFTVDSVVPVVTFTGALCKEMALLLYWNGLVYDVHGIRPNS